MYTFGRMSNTFLETEKPYLLIEPTRGWSALNVKELWQFRDLLTTLATRDVKLRYRQTALGAIWVILQPLLAAGIFAFVFGKVAKLPSDGVPYFLFAYAGLLGWNVFNSTLTKVSSCLIQNSYLVSKVFFPRLVLPLSSDVLIVSGLWRGVRDDDRADGDLCVWSRGRAFCCCLYGCC